MDQNTIDRWNDFKPTVTLAKTKKTVKTKSVKPKETRENK